MSRTRSGSVRSADGTTIAFDRYGDGWPVILIGGAYNDRSRVAGVAEAISSGNLAAVTYDRRGRGASTNNDSEFEPERELEDLSAVIETLGGSVSVFGHSSGAVLALEAAMHRLPIDRLVVYEPSYMVDGTRLLPPDDLDERMCALVREGRRDDAVVLFSTEAVGLPTASVEGMRASPVWRWLTALAHTLPYDLAVHHGYRLPTGRLAELELPLLALDGSESFPWIRATAQAVAQAISGARHRTLEGQDHSVLQHPEGTPARPRRVLQLITTATAPIAFITSDCEGLRERRQHAEVGADPSRSSGVAEDQLTRKEVFNQLAIEQLGIALDELPEALGAPALDVHGNEVEPRARDRLVILVLGAVQLSDMPDCSGHGLGRHVDRIEA